MKLYVCWGTFPTLTPGGHPCRNAHSALKRAGHDPQVVRSLGWALLPDIPFNVTPGRIHVKRETGSSEVPMLETDDGEVIQGSRQIVRWAEQNPV
jgi:hypothetical protein